MKIATALVQGDIDVHQGLTYQTETEQGKHTARSGNFLRDLPGRSVLCVYSTPPDPCGLSTTWQQFHHFCFFSLLPPTTTTTHITSLQWRMCVRTHAACRAMTAVRRTTHCCGNTRSGPCARPSPAARVLVALHANVDCGAQ